MDSAQAFELADVDAIGQAALVAAGEVSATELLDAALIRLEAARELNAVITDLFERGRAQAAELDASGRARAPHDTDQLRKASSTHGRRYRGGSRTRRHRVAHGTGR